MNCKICSSKTVRIEDNKKNIVYYNCIECDFIFIDENKIYPPDIEKLRYLKHNNSFENTNYVKLLNALIEKHIINNQAEIKNILDFGCGPTPVFAKLLKDKGFAVNIYDKYFFQNKYYLKQKYDLITLIEVIEHLKDPTKELNQLKKLLIRNGFFIIKTLFHPEDRGLFLKWWYKEDFTHISFFSKKTFEILADLLNMKLLKMNNTEVCIFQNV